MAKSWIFERGVRDRTNCPENSGSGSKSLSVMPSAGIAAHPPYPVLDRCRDSQSAFDTSLAALQKVADDDHHARFLHEPSLYGIGRELPFSCNFNNRKHLFIHSRNGQ